MHAHARTHTDTRAHAHAHTDRKFGVHALAPAVPQEQSILQTFTVSETDPNTDCWAGSPFICGNVFPVGQAMPVHPQHEHSVVPSRPPTGLAPLGDAELDVQPKVALGLGKRLNLDGNTSAGYTEEE